MSDQKLISPLLDGFIMGSPMSSRGGVRCCPAMKENSDEKYIVKILSIPASQVQVEALLLTGAYKTSQDAAAYFREVAQEVVAEAELLNTLAELEGFAPFEGWQIVPMEEGRTGFEVYLLSVYQRSLEKHTRRNPVTHLEAVNLGLDLCAALAISRRAGYLYVDLKPSNVFFTKDKQFRIGDLGFVKLDSLSYTVLPGKYRSPYAPWEVQDDLKTLNNTVDTYAVGMILYQIYNEGALPEPPADPKTPFPCPANADYEMSAIIMKAIDPDPEKRWADPMSMGQALVKYMQRNTVNNTPILPPSGILPAQDTEIAASAMPAEQSPEAAADADVPSEKVSDADILPEDSSPEEPAEESEAESPAEAENDDPDDMDFSIAFEDHGHSLSDMEEASIPESKPVPIKKQRVTTAQIRGRQIRNVVITLVILALLGCAAFWLYHNYYLQTIDMLSVNGTQSKLTVTVDTKMDETLLEVTCTDTYGNVLTEAVQNGEATFRDLLPDSLYRIELTVKGLHQLTGPTSEIFTTAALTNVVSISAITGPEDGSVMVNFTADGPEPEQWTITCSAEGETDVVQTFTGHTVTVKKLAVGKEYTLQLGTADGTQIIGENRTTFTVTRLILAENLRITGCEDGIMTVAWDAPEDTSVERWKVRCYSDDGYEESLEITGTEFTFTGIDTANAYTVEVTAEGMTESTRVTLTANPISVTGYTVDTSDPMRLTVEWTYEGNAPEGGWLLMYSFDALPDQQNVVKATQPSAVIEPHIPGTVYNLSLQAADSTFVFGDTHSFTTPEAPVLNLHDLSGHWITPFLLKTPEEEDWTAETIDQDIYTDTFQSGESISVVLKAADAFLLPKDVTPVLYVIRDGNGSVLSRYTAEENVIWEDLWYPDNYHNCELTIPKVPTEPGAYTVTIYFSHQFVASTGFTIIE